MFRCICVWPRIPHVATHLLHGDGDVAGRERKRTYETPASCSDVLFVWAKAGHWQVTGPSIHRAEHNSSFGRLHTHSTRTHPRWRGSLHARKTTTCSLSAWTPPWGPPPGLGQRTCLLNRSLPPSRNLTLITSSSSVEHMRP